MFRTLTMVVHYLMVIFDTLPAWTRYHFIESTGFMQIVSCRIFVLRFVLALANPDVFGRCKILDILLRSKACIRLRLCDALWWGHERREG